MKRPGQPRRTVGLPRGKSPSRSSLPARSSGIRRTPVKRRNAKRQKSEFARCYHSRERVRFVKNLGCVFCTGVAPIFGLISAGKSDNAHTATGGASYKAGYETIVPLCRTHHRMYDEHQAPLDNAALREVIQRAALEVERMWQASLTSKAGQHG